MSGKRTGFNTIVLIICISVIVTLLAATVAAQTAGSLSRGSRFTVVITGQPLTTYYVWDAGTFSMSGAAGDQPPVISGGTLNLQKDPPGGPYDIGMHQISSGGTILDDVAPSFGDFSNTNYYAQITTDGDGQALVEFRTSSNTGVQHYAIKVEDQGGNPGKLQIQANLYPRTTPPTTVIPTTIVTTPATLPPTPTETPTTIPPVIITVTPPPTTVPTPSVPVPVGIAIGAVFLCLLAWGRR
jgi:hypothetical protein